MDVARFPGRLGDGPVMSPRESLDYMRRLSAGLGVEAGPYSRDFRCPEGVVLLYQDVFARRVRDAYPGDQYPTTTGRLLLPTATPVAVAWGFGIGGPAAAVIMEDLVALGATRFVGLGVAGGLQHSLGVGDVVLCGEAIRDEGLSQHYLDGSAPARPSLRLTDGLREALARRGTPFVEGMTWTSDALYRETREQVRHYQKAGVLTVEMEAAAIFAVAAYRGVECAAVFVVSDSLADLTWNPDYTSPAIWSRLDDAFAAAADALTR